MKIAIVEDDSLDAALLQDYVQRYEKETHTEIQTEVFSDGLQFVNQYKINFDAVFLDIDMPFLNGIDTAKTIRKISASVPIIFVTRLARFAMASYPIQALDFLIKPVSYPAFLMTMGELDENLKQCKSLILHNKDGYFSLLIADIEYIEVKNHFLVFHFLGKTYKEWGNLSKLEEQLKPYSFSSCGASFLVNLKKVSQIQDDFVTVGTDRLKISRSHKKKFLWDLDHLVKEESWKH